MRNILIILMMLYSVNVFSYQPSDTQLHQLEHVCEEDSQGNVHCDYNWNG